MLFDKKAMMTSILNEKKRSHYFTSELGRQAYKNAQENFKSLYGTPNVKVKHIGIYDGEDMVYDGYEIVDGDSVYILVDDEGDK